MAENRKNAKQGTPVRQNSGTGRNGRNLSKAAKAKRKKRKIIILVIELIVLLLVLAGLWVAVKMSKIDTDSSFKADKVKNEKLTQETKDILGEYDTIALFGLDNRSNGNYNGGNSDVMMVARINKDTKEIKLVSVYRDTLLNMTDSDDSDAYSKANAAYAVGGPEQAVRMLNTNLDLDIKEYVSFDFNAVAEAVDLLGGVKVHLDLEEAVNMQGYQDEIAKMTGKDNNYINTEGEHNLDGVQAVAYARIRYVGNGDYERTERQREILNKMVEKALKSDIGTINKLIDTIFPEIKTSLSQTEMLGLAKDAFNYKMGDNAGFPLEHVNEKINVSYQKGKADCIVPADLATNVKQLHDFLFGTTDYVVTESVQNISDAIVDKTGVTAKKDE